MVIREDSLDRLISPAFEAKVVILGSSKVGKSTFVTTLTTGNYPGDTYVETIGATFHVYNPPKLTGYSATRLNLWCTSGAERFRALTGLYSRDCYGVILMFALDDRQSFNEIKYWNDTWLLPQGSGSAIKVLVGAKSDITADQRAVTREEG